MKRIIAVIFLFIVIICNYAFAEERNIAHAIWQAMGEAGNMDMSQAWELMGLFSFGETTADGEVTLFLTDDKSKIAKQVSWRNHPVDDSGGVDRFFLMLKCLLSKLDQEESLEEIELWIEQISPSVLLARQNRLFFKSSEKQFQDMIVFVQYDSKHNELYSLVTCTETNEWFSLD